MAQEAPITALIFSYQRDVNQMQQIKSLIFILAISLSTISLAESKNTAKSSLLLLVDISGSMSYSIGSGNADIKIEAAKKAAIDSVSSAVQNGLVEVAILAFEGGCASPIAKYIDFTTDEAELISFINQLYPAGGTPMAEAVIKANQFMENNGKPNALTQMIVLLADGQNDCGDINQAMATLKASGILFRHETVGFGIQPNSQASNDLRTIATISGGSYHHAQSATQLGDIFLSLVNTLTVIDLLGRFKHVGLGGNQPATTSSSKNRLMDLINSPDN